MWHCDQSTITDAAFGHLTNVRILDMGTLTRQTQPHTALSEECLKPLQSLVSLHARTDFLVDKMDTLSRLPHLQTLHDDSFNNRLSIYRRVAQLRSQMLAGAQITFPWFRRLLMDVCTYYYVEMLDRVLAPFINDYRGIKMHNQNACEWLLYECMKQVMTGDNNMRWIISIRYNHGPPWAPERSGETAVCNQIFFRLWESVPETRRVLLEKSVCDRFVETPFAYAVRGGFTTILINMAAYEPFRMWIYRVAHSQDIIDICGLLYRQQCSDTNKIKKTRRILSETYNVHMFRSAPYFAPYSDSDSDSDNEEVH
jgi:hypothetical protein